MSSELVSAHHLSWVRVWDLIWLYWVLLESSWSITYQLTLQLSPFPHNRIFGHSSTMFPRCQRQMCHFEKLCTCYCTVEHENLTLAMLILYFIFCLTLSLLIPFIAHTVSLMGHRAVKQERFIVARDEEVWKLWAIYRQLEMESCL